MGPHGGSDRSLLTMNHSKNSDTAVEFGDPNFLQCMEILAIGGHLLPFLATFSLCMHRTAISEFLVKILTLIF